MLCPSSVFREYAPNYCKNLGIVQKNRTEKKAAPIHALHHLSPLSLLRAILYTLDQ